MGKEKCCANCVYRKEKPILYDITHICTRGGKEKYLDKFKLHDKKCLFFKEKKDF